MVQKTQAKALQLVLAHEGGFSDHPQDPGGATNKGITQAVYDGYRTSNGLATRSVRSITNAEVAAIYDQQYWDRANCDRLPAGLDYAVFDYAVNSGVSRAAKDLQRQLGVKADGVIGMGTLAAAEGADTQGVINGLCDRRMRFLRSLRTFGTFGRGWTTRVEGVRRAALELAGTQPVAPQPVKKSVGDAKASESSVAITKTKPGIGAIIGAAGVSGQTVIATAQQVQPNIDESLFGRMALIGFVVLMLVGGFLLAWSFYQRLQEKGAI